MPSATTRRELVEAITTSHDKLRRELRAAGAGIAECICDGDWVVRDLLEVRLWWTARVVDWIDAGRRGETPDVPAPGYKWSETPRLNQHVIERSKRRSFRAQCAALDRAVARVRRTIDRLDDRELFATSVFAWAGKWPVARWLPINTARQYSTARTLVRRAVRNRRSQ